jgi:hypothetical protein
LQELKPIFGKNGRFNPVTANAENLRTADPGVDQSFSNRQTEENFREHGFHLTRGYSAGGHESQSP